MVIQIIPQRLLGIMLLGFVGMGVGDWQPPPVSAAAEPLPDAIFASGYLIPAVLLVCLLCEVALLANRYAALAAVVLFPVGLNIFLFHAFLNPASIPMAAALLAPNLLVLFAERRKYYPLLSSK